jgi:hypothetical protein
MKTGPDALDTAKMSPREQNIKTGPDAVGTAENGSGSANHVNGTRRRRYSLKRVRERKKFKRDSRPSVPPKTGHGAQTKKTRPDTECPADK